MCTIALGNIVSRGYNSSSYIDQLASPLGRYDPWPQKTTLGHRKNGTKTKIWRSGRLLYTATIRRVICYLEAIHLDLLYSTKALNFPPLKISGLDSFISLTTIRLEHFHYISIVYK